MKYILSNPHLVRKARVLANKLGELLGEEILVRTSLLPGNSMSMIVRYGTSFNANIDTEYNSSYCIRMAGNKLELSEFLQEKEFPHVELNIGIPVKYPVVVRKELNRGGGIGMEIYENDENYIVDYNNWLNPYPWSYWYDFQFELGVHILGGEIVRVFKKIREEGLEEEKYPIRNTQRGYNFKLRNDWQERYKGLDKFVKQLYEIFPIQFARLDIGYDKSTGGYRLIEINSAPDLSQNRNTLELYAKFLAERINQ